MSSTHDVYHSLHRLLDALTRLVKVATAKLEEED